MAGRLKLQACDAEDLQIIAACLQDALVPVRDMVFLPRQRRFVLLLNRFRWEAGASAPPTAMPEEDASFEAKEEPGPRFERIHSGLCFDRVRRVHSRGIRRRDKDEILELLTISTDGRSVLLLFAGGAAIRLEVDAVRCFLEDLGEAWPTRWRPSHGAEQEQKDLAQ